MTEERFSWYIVYNTKTKNIEITLKKINFSNNDVIRINGKWHTYDSYFNLPDWLSPNVLEKAYKNYIATFRKEKLKRILK